MVAPLRPARCHHLPLPDRSAKHTKAGQTFHSTHMTLLLRVWRARCRIAEFYPPPLSVELPLGAGSLASPLEPSHHTQPHVIHFHHPPRR